MDPSTTDKRRAVISQQGVPAGVLEEGDANQWRFTYFPEYSGEPVSLTMPIRIEPYDFDHFPAPFEGVLPEGRQLEALLRTHKLDRDDAFGQLLVVGADLVGSLSVEAAEEPVHF